jgi:hypothetical protein
MPEFYEEKIFELDASTAKAERSTIEFSLCLKESIS